MKYFENSYTPLGHIFQSIGKTNFTTPKHLLLPVPIDDIDANPNLLPNNPGY